MRMEHSAAAAALDSLGSDEEHLRRIVALGDFVSALGYFDAARMLLQSARATAESGATTHRASVREARCDALLALAENEVRHWDSIRRWDLEDLSLLLDASRAAVDIFRDGVRAAQPAARQANGQERLAKRIALCTALSRYAK